MPTKLLASLCALGLVLAIAYSIPWPSPTPVRGGGPPSGEVQPDRVEHETASTSDIGGSRDELVLRVRVIDAESSEPLPNAYAIWVEGDGAEASLASDVCASCDAAARLVVRAMPRLRLLVRCAGYVPQFVDATSGDHELRMVRAGSMQVAVVDGAGRPIGGARCVLSARPLSEFQSLLRAARVGHPHSSRPVWVQPADAVGVALFDELPDGPYYLNVLHDTFVPVHESGANGLFDVSAGLTRVTVEMVEMHGAVFMCPSRARAVSVNCRAPRGLVVSEPRVLRRRGPIAEALSGRFPDAITHVHLPNDPSGEPVPVEVSLSLADGTLWSGSADLTPVSQIGAPVFLELYQGPTRSVLVRLVDSTGRQYPGVPLSLFCAQQGRGFKLETGEVITVPYGSYDVNPVQTDTALLAALLGKKVVVDDVSPEQFAFDLGDPVSAVEIVVHYPNDEVLCPLTLSLRDEKGRGPGIANYRPERGVIRRWVTGEVLNVRVTSIAYREVRHPATQVSPSEVTRIDIHLVEK